MNERALVASKSEICTHTQHVNTLTFKIIQYWEWMRMALLTMTYGGSNQKVLHRHFCRCWKGHKLKPRRFCAQHRPYSLQNVSECCASMLINDLSLSGITGFMVCRQTCNLHTRVENYFNLLYLSRMVLDSKKKSGDIGRLRHLEGL